LVDFRKIKTKVIKSNKLILKLEIELNESSYTAQEAAERIAYLINGHYEIDFSNFILFLLRETKSNTWELKNLEINEK
jgi:hypothetical protein